MLSINKTRLYRIHQRKIKLLHCFQRLVKIRQLMKLQKKPHIIEFYISTKGAVDSLDQMCRNNSYRRSTRRWPLYVFYGIINLACLNSMIIYIHTCKRLKKAPLIRLQYLIKLNEELMTDCL